MIVQEERRIDVAAGLSLSRAEIVADYRAAYASRQVSLVGRREVMSGKAKFGIFGDGKEVPQVAMARAARAGDIRSGYYRDQTFAFVTGGCTIREYFAQLYAHANRAADPMTGGRAMNAHFATRFLDEQGAWRDLTTEIHSAADVSPTGSQMPRMVGLAYASKLYRELPELAPFTQFSRQGDEICWGTIGNASCAEGMFWEAVNAVGVLGGPLVLSIWDDGYGISVPNEVQLARDLSELLSGFRRSPGGRDGFDIYRVKAWDYVALLAAYQSAAETARREHVPAILHVVEVTQPQGHSTSGSHERYKSPERLAWEEAYDCLGQMRRWLLDEGLAAEDELVGWEAADAAHVEAEREAAWAAFTQELRADAGAAAQRIRALAGASPAPAPLTALAEQLSAAREPLRRDVAGALRSALVAERSRPSPERAALADWQRRFQADNAERYGSQLLSPTAASPLQVAAVAPTYAPDSEEVFGFDVVNAGFDAILARDPRVLAFGEDLGRLGDVNQGFKGLQEKYGALRVADTGIREATILGQAIGLALRGLRPICEIQYLDYLLYALQIMSDDLATLRWRTVGGQAAPVIVRTRGHRLEGIWHSGSPMGAALHLLRGMHVLVPRDFTRAAGFYNTLLAGDDPALVVEVLNGYRVRERMPANIGEIRVPLGLPEVLRPGGDVTLVTYGACCRIALEAARQLAEVGIDTEVIDVQSLLPFDLPGVIGDSLRKTGRIVFLDEDVPGGATAYMLREVLERQGGYYWLDAPPRTLTGAAHRPAYGSDGDYFSKPGVDTVFDALYDLMGEADPARYPRYDR